ncbi:pentatricopeptide repeat-containing protein [Tanacetum coccineum]
MGSTRSLEKDSESFLSLGARMRDSSDRQCLQLIAKVLTAVNSSSLSIASGKCLDAKKEAKRFQPATRKALQLDDHAYVQMSGDPEAYAQKADPLGAGRISNRMELAGYHPSLESCTYLVEAYSRKGNPDQARSHFDEIIKLGYKPDDHIALLLQLEKDGIEHSVATYSVLVDWLGKLQLIDEVEDLLGKFAEKGVSPSLDVHISLCDMYARAKEEKKALQALGDAERLNQLMTAQGFKTSDQLKMTLHAAEIFSSKKPLSMK